MTRLLPVQVEVGSRQRTGFRFAWRCILLACVFCIGFGGPALSQEEAAQGTDGETKHSGGVPLSEEQIQAHIGAMGEVEEIPEGFQFSQAEELLWLSDHLQNIVQPTQLYYEFVKTGTVEEGFSDAVYLSVYQLNDDGTKTARLDFFTGSRKQQVNPANVTDIMGNPVLGIYFQGDVYEMSRLTKGNWRHFHKRIKMALREATTVEPVMVEFAGETVPASKISFNPYVDDPYRSRFEKYSGKLYEIILSEHIPGGLYSIRTLIVSDSDNTPLMEESLSLVSTKALDN